MAEETEAGDVRRTRCAGIPRDARRDAVEPQHALDRGRHDLVWCGAVLRGRGDDAGPERLGEEEPIAGAQATLDEHAVGMDAAGNAQPILRLVVDDGVAAGDDAAGLCDLLGTATKDLGDDALVHLTRKAGDREREQHLAAHRVHVGHGVGGGHGAPRPRVVHDRWKEVDGLDERELVADPVDRRIVGGTEPDEEVARGLRRQRGTAQHAQHLLEISRSHLRRSAGAGRVRGQPHLLARARVVTHTAWEARSIG